MLTLSWKDEWLLSARKSKKCRGEGEGRPSESRGTKHIGGKGRGPDINTNYQWKERYAVSERSQKTKGHAEGEVGTIDLRKNEVKRESILLSEMGERISA